MRVALSLLLLLAACGHAPVMPEPIRIVETQRVEIPVPVRRTPPAELVAPMRVEALPVFIEPGDAAASSALSIEGERQLRALIDELLTRDAAWRAWATESIEVNGPAKPDHPP